MSLIHRVVVVEDDRQQAEDLQYFLKLQFPQAEVTWIRYETDFAKAIENGSILHCSAIVMDYRLDWSKLKGAKSTKEEDGPLLAGLRCLRALHRKPGGAAIPVAIRTVAEVHIIGKDLESFGSSVVCFGKTISDTEALFTWLRAWLQSDIQGRRARTASS